MRVVGLVSGGKDSCYNLMQCVNEGHEIVALANLRPKEKDELDSFMYQTVGYHVLQLYSEAIGLPLYQGVINRDSVCKDAHYTVNEQDEVEDLYVLLKNIKEKVNFDAVASGAVLSDYQRVRVENVCSRLGLQSLAYLWQRDQKELLEEMISSNLHAIVIKVAALGLDPRKHLGKSLSEMYSHLCKLNKEYGVHVCGEGGEYESLTLDCPLFKNKIIIDDVETITHSDDPFAPVAYLHFNKMHLEDKNMDLNLTLLERLRMSGFSGREMTITPYLFSEAHDINSNCCKVGFEKSSTIAPTGNQSLIKVRRVGKLVHISGARCTAAQAEGLTICQETTLVMEELHRNLQEQNSSTALVLLVHLYVCNMKNFADVNCVYKEYFKYSPPARVCVEVAMEKGAHLRIDCLALCGDMEINRKTLHVESISHWAQANIGPYSQAVKNEDMVFFSGSIGLRPASMTLVDGGAKVQGPLAFQHILSVQSVIQPGISIENLAFLTCYCTSREALSYVEQMYKTIQKQNPHLPFVAAITSGLPKSAQVEWHAGSYSYLTEDQGHTLVKNFDDFDVHIKGCICNSDYNFFTSSIVPLPETRQLPMSIMLRTISDEYKRTALSSTISVDNALSMRVFYDLEAIHSMHEFQSAFIGHFRSEFETVPAVVFVPTSGLNYRAVVSVLVHCVTK